MLWDLRLADKSMAVVSPEYFFPGEQGMAGNPLGNGNLATKNAFLRVAQP